MFEAVSGVTTTGATVLVGLDGLPPGLLIWRSLLHMVRRVGRDRGSACSSCRLLNVGGVSYFKIESSAIDDNPFERFSDLFDQPPSASMSPSRSSARSPYAAAGMNGLQTPINPTL